MIASEIAVVKILAAYIEWPDDDESNNDMSMMLEAVGDMLSDLDLATYHGPTDKGRDLLDRARKAGVL